jgi:hypothetical protein
MHARTIADRGSTGTQRRTCTVRPGFEIHLGLLQSVRPEGCELDALSNVATGGVPRIKDLDVSWAGFTACEGVAQSL